jgi:hypothetical protein
MWLVPLLVLTWITKINSNKWQMGPCSLQTVRLLLGSVDGVRGWNRAVQVPEKAEFPAYCAEICWPLGEVGGVQLESWAHGIWQRQRYRGWCKWESGHLEQWSWPRRRRCWTTLWWRLGRGNQPILGIGSVGGNATGRNRRQGREIAARRSGSDR